MQLQEMYVLNYIKLNLHPSLMDLNCIFSGQYAGNTLTRFRQLNIKLITSVSLLTKVTLYECS